MVRLYVYATASALVFDPLFFAKLSAFVGTLASFGTFAAGFFARPIGGLVFGRFGRKRALVDGDHAFIAEWWPRGHRVTTQRGPVR